MRKLISVAIMILAGLIISCTKQDSTFDLEKINARTELDEALKEIDEKVKDIRVDTLLAQKAEFKEKIEENEKELSAWRDRILTKITEIDTVGKESWNEFKAEMDTLLVRTEKSIDKAQDELTPDIGEEPLKPPVY